MTNDSVDQNISNVEQNVLHLGDCRDVLPSIPSDSIDSIVTDPPYELGFMGKAWDSSGIAYDVRVWRECLRVLKPGGHLLAFGGSRTYHRLVTAVEDAGFEIRDQIMWLYAQGFPKSHNLAGQWGGWGTALKPAHEPIVLARKALIGTVASNMERYATGAINIDSCRIPIPQGADPSGEIAARWPANFIHDGSDEVLSSFPHTQSGKPCGIKAGGKGNAFGHYNGGIAVTGYGDAGSASRFFYCAKTTKTDRGEGNNHPTVKPTELMRYLCRLVTRPGGVVLDPFMGSGSTGKAATSQGFQFIGIELNPEYIKIAERRLRRDSGMFADIVTA